MESVTSLDKKSKFRSLISILLASILVFSLFAGILIKGRQIVKADVTYVDGTATAINAAITALGGAGNIYINAGEFTLGGDVELKYSGIKIIGPGSDTCTINIDDMNDYFWMSDGHDECRITGINFDHTDYEDDNAIAIYVADPSFLTSGGHYTHEVTSFRIDHCDFTNFGEYYGPIVCRGNNTGVIDHCYFYTYDSATWGYGIYIDGNNTYTTDTSAYVGTANNIFIEDCEFHGCDHANACNRGAHFVIRHCDIYTSVRHAIDAHGGYSDYGYSTIISDIYNNNIYGPDTTYSRAVSMNGGQFFLHDNYTEDTDWSHFCALYLEGAATLSMALYCIIHDSYIWDNTGDRTDVVVSDNEHSGTSYIFEGTDPDTDPGEYYLFEPDGADYSEYTYPHPLVEETEEGGEEEGQYIYVGTWESTGNPGDNLTDFVGNTGNPDITGASDMSSNPFYPLISTISDVTEIPEYTLWALSSMLIIIGVTLVTFKYTNHLLAASGVGGVATAGCVAFGMLAWWALIVIVIFIITILVYERVPSF